MIPQIRSGNGIVYADLTSISEKIEIERLFSINPWLKENVVKDV